MRLLQKLTPTLLFLAMAGGLLGCNTMEGAGEDIESTGEAIEEEAE